MKKFFLIIKETFTEIIGYFNSHSKKKEEINLEDNADAPNESANLSSKKFVPRKYLGSGILIIIILILIGVIVNNQNINSPTYSAEQSKSAKVDLKKYFPQKDMIKVSFQYVGTSTPLTKIAEKISIIEKDKSAYFEKLYFGKEGGVILGSAGYYELTDEGIIEYNPETGRSELLINNIFDSDFSFDKSNREMRVLNSYYSTTTPSGNYEDCLVVESLLYDDYGDVSIKACFAPGLGLVYQDSTFSDGRVYKSFEVTNIVYAGLDDYDFSKYIAGSNAKIQLPDENIEKQDTKVVEKSKSNNDKLNTQAEKGKYLNALQYIYDIEGKALLTQADSEIADIYYDSSEKWKIESWRINSIILDGVPYSERESLWGYFRNTLDEIESSASTEAYKKEDGGGSATLMMYYKLYNDGLKKYVLNQIDTCFDDGFYSNLKTIEKNKYVNIEVGFEISFLEKYAGRYKYIESDWYQGDVSREKSISIYFDSGTPKFIYEIQIYDKPISTEMIYDNYYYFRDFLGLRSDKKYTVSYSYASYEYVPEEDFKSKEELDNFASFMRTDISKTFKFNY